MKENQHVRILIEWLSWLIWVQKLNFKKSMALHVERKNSFIHWLKFCQVSLINIWKKKRENVHVSVAAACICEYVIPLGIIIMCYDNNCVGGHDSPSHIITSLGWCLCFYSDYDIWSSHLVFIPCFPLLFSHRFSCLRISPLGIRSH